jgi:hypothetical protein
MKRFKPNKLRYPYRIERGMVGILDRYAFYSIDFPEYSSVWIYIYIPDWHAIIDYDFITVAKDINSLEEAKEYLYYNREKLIEFLDKFNSNENV